MARSPSVPWTREHQLIALNLYRKIPFGHYDKGKPIVIQLAGLMGRSPSSLAMKLSNFASLDPFHKARNVKGLNKATIDDRAMWAEFQANLPTLGPESEQLMHDLFTSDDSLEVDFLEGKTAKVAAPRSFGGESTESIATVKIRRGQQFFRQSILRAYDVRCCVSGINVPRMLVASHIRPWRDFPDDRLDPRNGLCLSSLHDAAFDSGLMTFDEDLKVLLSSGLKKFLPQASLELNFLGYEGKAIRLPDKLATPAEEFLKHHREHIFAKE
ncbi:MAG: HNH endonuclease [Luteolibacter sp.]|uniref:HNH endonuclease n=1 Tax=Luteolibacter sp. TaxID=1962973 RepID=UPI003264F2C0